MAPRRALFGEGGTEVAVFFEITRPGHAPLPSSLFASQPLRPKRDASAVAALLPSDGTAGEVLGCLCDCAIAGCRGIDPTATGACCEDSAMLVRWGGAAYALIEKLRSVMPSDSINERNCRKSIRTRCRGLCCASKRPRISPRSCYRGSAQSSPETGNPAATLPGLVLQNQIVLTPRGGKVRRTWHCWDECTTGSDECAVFSRRSGARLGFATSVLLIRTRAFKSSLESFENHRTMVGAPTPFSQPLLPGESMPNDGGEIIVLWLPPERRAGALGSATICAGSPGRRGAISTVKSTPETRLTISITSRTEKP